MPQRHVRDLFDLSDRVAIVTGGTRGIGRAIAEGLAQAGAKVVVASRKAEACAATVEELTAAGHDVYGVPTHLGDLDAVEALVAATVEHHGALDIVVNNAANALTEPVGAFSAAAYDKSNEVNVKGPVFLTQAAIPHLARSGHASVINVVSAGAWLFAGDVSLYAATKAAMVSFTKSFAAALAPQGIRVNALAPGTVDTDMVRNNPPAVQAALVGAGLLHRAADPWEMVGPALFLAADASSFVTGSVVHADGGLVPR